MCQSIREVSLSSIFRVGLVDASVEPRLDYSAHNDVDNREFVCLTDRESSSASK